MTHVLTSDNGVTAKLHILRQVKTKLLTRELRDTIASAYAREYVKYIPRVLFHDDGTLEDGVVTLCNAEGRVFASLVFRAVPGGFKTKCEAVHKDYQRKGYGSMLFECMGPALYLLHEHSKLPKQDKFNVVSCVDKPDMATYGAFMLKNGFTQMPSPTGSFDINDYHQEVAFCKEIKPCVGLQARVLDIKTTNKEIKPCVGA